MVIEQRGVIPSRFDAPFIGTLICATGCYAPCKGCFHKDHYKSETMVQRIDADLLLDMIKRDTFCEGIILGYLEWLDYQYEQALYLIRGAFKRNLQAMLYTRRDEDELRRDYPELFIYKGLYIKCGPYDESKLSHTYTSYGIPLASTNQYIIQV